MVWELTLTATRCVEMDWDWCVSETLVSNIKKREEKKTKKKVFECRFVPEVHLWCSSIHGKTICICSSATLFSLPGLLSHCRTWLIGIRWLALQIPLNTHEAPRRGLCCLNDLQTFGSFVETIRVSLIHVGCDATLWLQLEMKWQDDGGKADEKDHDALHGELMVLNTVMHKIWPTAQKEVWIIQVCWQTKMGIVTTMEWQNIRKYIYVDIKWCWLYFSGLK